MSFLITAEGEIIENIGITAEEARPLPEYLKNEQAFRKMFKRRFKNYMKNNFGGDFKYYEGKKLNVYSDKFIDDFVYENQGKVYEKFPTFWMRDLLNLYYNEAKEALSDNQDVWKRYSRSYFVKEVLYHQSYGESFKAVKEICDAIPKKMIIDSVQKFKDFITLHNEFTLDIEPTDDADAIYDEAHDAIYDILRLQSNQDGPWVPSAEEYDEMEAFYVDLIF